MIAPLLNSANRCNVCGGKVDRGKLCDDCRKSREDQTRKLRDDRVAAGLCSFCGVEPLARNAKGTKYLRLGLACQAKTAKARARKR